MIASTLNYVLLEACSSPIAQRSIWTSILMLGALVIIPGMILLMIFLIKLMNRKLYGNFIIGDAWINNNIFYPGICSWSRIPYPMKFVENLISSNRTCIKQQPMTMLYDPLNIRIL